MFGLVYAGGEGGGVGGEGGGVGGGVGVGGLGQELGLPTPSLYEYVELAKIKYPVYNVEMQEEVYAV